MILLNVIMHCYYYLSSDIKIVYLWVYAKLLKEKTILGAFERKSPQGFSNDYPVVPDCILG